MITRHISGKMIVIIALFLSIPGYSQSTLFYFTSSPNSWIGQGQSVLATPTNGFYILPISGVNQHEVGFVIGSTTPSIHPIWDIEMDIPSGYLTNGFYANAERLGGNIGPGLNFDAPGRADNTLTGYFDVLDISYDANQTLISFAADFVQYDVGVPSLWNQGSIRYNSIIPVPEPSTYSLFGICILVFCLLRVLPNKAPEPTAVGACRSAVAVHAASRRWLNFFR
jgi:hypothetical protein